MQSTSSGKDYIIGAFLPTLFDDHLNQDEAITEFTKAEADRLQFAGLPLRVNHSERENFIIGRVEASAIDPATRRAHALLSIDQCANADDNVADNWSRRLAATFASNSIACGHYAGLSLGHEFLTLDFDGPKLMTVKIPQEISVCQQGLRPDTTIKHFFPCAKTVERLHNSGHLESMLARFGFGGLVTASASTPSSVYIGRLVDEIAKKRETAIARYNFYSPSPGIKRTLVMASQQPAPTGDAMETDAPAASATPAPEKAPAVITPLVTPGTDRINLLQLLDNEQKKTLELEKKLREQGSMAEQIAEFNRQKELVKKEEEEKRAKEMERKRREGELHLRTIADMFRVQGLENDEKTKRVLQIYEQELAVDPISAADKIAATAHVMVTASNSEQAARKKAMELAENAIAVGEAAHIKHLVESINQNRIAGLAIRTSASPSTVGINTGGGLAQRFEQQPVLTSGVVNASATAPSATTMTTSSNKDFDPRQTFEHLQKQLGRMPSYDEVAHGGTVMVRTGQFQASASGSGYEEVVETSVRFPNKRHFGMQQFVPEVNAQIDDCIRKYSRAEALRMDAKARQVTPAHFFAEPKSSLGSGMGFGAF